MQPLRTIKRHYYRFLVAALLTVILLYNYDDRSVSVFHQVSPQHALRYVADRRYLTFGSSQYRGLGNVMFTMAATIGIADANNMTPLVPSDVTLKDHFATTLLTAADDSQLGPYLVHSERNACEYDERTLQLPPYWGVRLGGYYQSWKYFANAEPLVRKHFQLKPSVVNKARRNLFQLNAEVSRDRTVTRIGVHVRRGDMALDSSIENGYTVATADYVNQAMEYFRQTFSSKRVAFIVCSDDVAWCEKNIHGNDVSFSKSGDHIVDFALLTLCDHVIMTVGSYGWWAAWLVNGTTIYYKDWPAPGSNLDQQVNKEDYFPPHWLSM